MSDPLQKVIQLARKEKKTRRGRRGYSDELKEAIREASNSNTKAAIGKSTGISFPTLHRIIGPTRRSTGRKRATPRGRGTRGRRAGIAAQGNVRVQISIDLPSGATLNYSDVRSLRADAMALSSAAKGLE